MKWPIVIDEDETLDQVLGGKSLSRFGDGEFNLAIGGKCVTQKHNIKIQNRLLSILYHCDKCLVGIPRVGVGPKSEFWSRYLRNEIVELFGHKEYASAFITRPDSAPWINRPDYWNKLKGLWAGKDITLVRGSEKSLTSEMLPEARTITEIVAPSKHAFDHYDYLLGRIGAPKTVLLCLGPTATILAVDLAKRGSHAIDLGHIGMFLRKFMQGQPMIVTKEDKAVDKERS